MSLKHLWIGQPSRGRPQLRLSSNYTAESLAQGGWQLNASIAAIVIAVTRDYSPVLRDLDPRA